ncbi:hypothetical protein K3495_g7526 [Podosphaera aphanis]|nr:hypothetical protein K3495_g7526 [Podosphaera aphanis]
MTSNHVPLIIIVPYNLEKPRATPKLRFATLVEENFLSLLSSNLTERESRYNLFPFSLDKRAEKIVRILYSSYEGSTKKSLPRNIGKPWRDQSCRDARKLYREISCVRTPSLAEKKTFRKVVKKAKNCFFQKKLDEASNAKDAFDITKWHKTKGNFRPPALLNPISPNNPPANTLEDKKKSFSRKSLMQPISNSRYPTKHIHSTKNFSTFPRAYSFRNLQGCT